MKILSIICQKGGTSKTTIAVNLAVAAQAAGLETVVIDLDPQVTACVWKDLRGEEATPTVVAIAVPHLDRALKAAAENGAQLAIVDTAGRAEAAATAAARVADAVLVPMQPSVFDLSTLQSTLDVIAASGNNAPVRVVLARVKSFGTRHEDSAAFLEGAHVGVCPIMIGERVTYQDAPSRGQGVTEFDPSSKAAQEINELYEYASKLLSLPTSKQAKSAKNRSENGEAKPAQRRHA